MRWFVLVIVLVAACGPSVTTITFEFVHGSGKDAPTFRASASDANLIERVRDELKKPQTERSLHLHGKISVGSGDNSPWSWHFDEGEWNLAEISMELCDAQPSHVEENLEQWLKEVGSYCPWASRVSREL